MRYMQNKKKEEVINSKCKCKMRKRKKENDMDVFIARKNKTK